MSRSKKVPGSYKRRGASIRVTLTFEGRRVRFTVPTTQMVVAHSVGSRRYAELIAGRNRTLAGLQSGVLVSQLLTDFEETELPLLSAGTIRSYGDSLKPIRAFFLSERADRDVSRVGPADIKHYLAWRKTHRLDGRGDTVHNRTLEKDRAVLYRIFGFAESNEYRDGNPVRLTKRPKADKHEPVILTDDQYDRLIDSASTDPMLQLFILILGETGMRCESEALHVRWTDVSFDERRITVKSARDGHRTKSGKSRLVPITDRLMTALRSHFEDHRLAMFGGQRTEYVIHHEATRRHHLAGKRVRSLRNSFKGAAERAELPAGFRQHDLRHRRVTTWIAAGHSIATIQMAMGHSDVRTTMGYCSLLPEHTDALLAEPSQRWQPNSPTMAMVR